MKKILTLTSVLLFISLSNYAQTAVDWTKLDCSGISHNLYTYLNNEDVVIMEFAMGCSSCTNAGARLLSTKDKYAISNPGKVNVFYMDYWPGNTCATVVLPTTTPYAFDAVFDHSLAEKDNYFASSSPMPGIAIAAGSSHQIIYQVNSFVDADTTLIEQAITAFFATANIKENLFENTITLSPNPSTGDVIINFTNTETENINISLFNLNGQLIKGLFNEKVSVGDFKKIIDIRSYPKGLYYINISNSKYSIHKKIVVN
ncbi:MAG: T9SS type A sorting domain-containing protein [Bacteroidetes bacterium]|nr:T9SS type A sorting domain-containing protein [Bacteroidota bacterium]